jgi:hypothetical protein
MRRVWVQLCFSLTFTVLLALAMMRKFLWHDFACGLSPTTLVGGVGVVVGGGDNGVVWHVCVCVCVHMKKRGVQEGEI